MGSSMLVHEEEIKRILSKERDATKAQRMAHSVRDHFARS